MKQLPRVVTDFNDLEYVKVVAKKAGGSVYSDVPYVKIKFYSKAHFPEIVALLIKSVFPRDSFEFYDAQSHGGLTSNIPAVRIRRATSIERPEAHIIILHSPGEAFSEFVSIPPAYRDGKSRLYILEDRRKRVFYGGTQPFTLKEARAHAE